MIAPVAEPGVDGSSSRRERLALPLRVLPEARHARAIATVLASRKRRAKKMRPAGAGVSGALEVVTPASYSSAQRERCTGK